MTDDVGCSGRHQCTQCVLSLNLIFPAVGRADHHDADCFVLIILSHGDEEGVYGIDGVISPDQMIEVIKGNRCPDLTGKPKLIFIQVTFIDSI